MSGPVMDLSTLKGGNRQRQIEAAAERLRHHGLVCGCGERVQSEGVRVFGVWTGLVPTPQGAQDAAIFAQAVFHSRACPEFLAAIKDGITFDLGFGAQRVRALGCQDNPAVEWFAPAVASNG